MQRGRYIHKKWKAPLSQWNLPFCTYSNLAGSPTTDKTRGLVAKLLRYFFFFFVAFFFVAFFFVAFFFAFFLAIICHLLLAD
jgi:hypothetical protein